MLLFCGNLFSQARIVVNNNGYIVLDNAAFLVIDNSNANALITAGTGGNIISEDEDDAIKWNIGTTTGNYQIPWTTSSGFKIPFAMNITGAGTGSGDVIFSTYETATDMNVPWPSTVTHMNSSILGGADGSLFVADRFWRVNANNYTAKPTISMTLGYDPSANEIAGTNTIVEGNLQAQRFNTTAGDWEGLLFGTNDAGNDRVTGINIAAADFFDFWIVVDNTTPLPVTLASFDAQCEGNNAIINWSTASEINNDYFVVEKSYDGNVYFELETVQGAGNSSINISYNAFDNDDTDNVYYRLKQVDFNGTVTYYGPVSANCSDNTFQVSQFLFGESNFQFNISTMDEEVLDLFLYDVRGRLVTSEKINVAPGDNKVNLTDLSLSRGMYLLSLIGQKNVYSMKLMKQ